jgi:hypothetical protein
VYGPCQGAQRAQQPLWRQADALARSEVERSLAALYSSNFSSSSGPPLLEKLEEKNAAGMVIDAILRRRGHPHGEINGE